MWEEFTGIVDAAPEHGGFVARCLERPGASGRGRTADEALRRLADCLALTLAEHRAARVTRLPPSAGRWRARAH